jgi:hypothetical protein
MTARLRQVRLADRTLDERGRTCLLTLRDEIDQILRQHEPSEGHELGRSAS